MINRVLIMGIVVQLPIIQLTDSNTPFTACQLSARLTAGMRVQAVDRRAGGRARHRRRRRDDALGTRFVAR